jgi:PAS domain S-box-containing protein
MVNDALTYQELENQIVELKKQNEILRLHFSIQKKEGREYYYNKILNNIGDPVFVKDEQSRLLIVNDAFSDLFDLYRDNIIGKTLAEDVSPSERESFLKIDKQVLEDGIENINEETLTVRGGETRTISTKKT